MSHYFQRYSQRENHITNATLMLLNYVYQHSVIKLQKILNEITGNAVYIGLEFNNQQTETNIANKSKSILDGYIHQSEINIYIEAKHGNNKSDEQLHRHLNNIANKPNATLICLTKSDVPDSQKIHGVCYTTYQKIIDILNDNIMDWEEGLQNIVDDYQELLQEHNLLDNKLSMFVSPVGKTLEINQKYGVYYDHITRPTRSSAHFIGMYCNKVIQLIGKIQAVIVYNGREFITERGSSGEDINNKILQSIEASKVIYKNFDGVNCRFFITDFHKTNFQKKTDGGLQGLKYFDLSKYGITEDMNIKDIANCLNNQSWKD